MYNLSRFLEYKDTVPGWGFLRLNSLDLSPGPYCKHTGTIKTTRPSQPLMIIRDRTRGFVTRLQNLSFSSISSLLTPSFVWTFITYSLFNYFCILRFSFPTLEEGGVLSKIKCGPWSIDVFRLGTCLQLLFSGKCFDDLVHKGGLSPARSWHLE